MRLRVKSCKSGETYISINSYGFLIWTILTSTNRLNHICHLFNFGNFGHLPRWRYTDRLYQIDTLINTLNLILGTRVRQALMPRSAPNEDLDGRKIRNFYLTANLTAQPSAHPHFWGQMGSFGDWFTSDYLPLLF